MLGMHRVVRACWPLVATSLIGCLPVIAHTPHVESGAHFTVVNGLSLGALKNAGDSPRRNGAPLPWFGVRESYGIRSSRDADGAAVELGAQVFLTGVVADAYVQAPPRWTGETDLGFGVAAIGGAVAGPMAYVQMGRNVSDDLYLFTTQGLGRFSRRANLRTGNNRPAISWQPTIAVEPIQSLGHIRYVFVTATVGRTFNGCIQIILGCNVSSSASLSVGVALWRPPAQRQ